MGAFSQAGILFCKIMPNRNKYMRGWRGAHKKEQSLWWKEYRKKYKDFFNLKQRGYYKLHRKANLLNKKKYYEKYKQEIIRKAKQKYSVSPETRIRHCLRVRLRKAIKMNKKMGSAIDNLGCSIEELKIFFSKKFQPGMTWDNYGFCGWHIDHIIPLCSFDLTNREQYLKACHYTNLQPLWAKDNLHKYTKVVGATVFQGVKTIQ